MKRTNLSPQGLASAFTLLLMLFTALPVWGAAYYVKTGGNDTLDGLSDATAWATVAKVTAAAKSGDTVFFRSQDTWSSATLPVLAATGGVTYDGSTYGSGTRAILKATGGYTGNSIEAVVNIFAGNVTFKGFEVDGNAQVTGGIYVGMHAPASISGITIDNCVVHDNGGPETTPTSYTYGIHIGSIMNVPTTISNVAVTNTTVYNTGHEGIAIYPTWSYFNNRVDGVLLRNCTIHDTAHWGGNTWGNGIYLVNDADNVTVEFTTIYNTFLGIGVGTSTTNTGSPNNVTVRYNILHDNTVAGLTFTCLSGCTSDGSFYGNLIYNNGKPWQYDYSAEILFSNDNFTTSVFNFYNNTIYSTGSTAATKYGVWLPSWGTGIQGTPVINFKNNIVYTGNYPAINDYKGSLVHSNNLIYRSSGTADTHVISGIAGTTYDNAGVTAYEATARKTDPLFTGGVLPVGFKGAYGVDLTPNTAYFAVLSKDAIDTGVTLGAPYNGCINGAGLAVPLTRPQGAYDIGAYESAGAPAATPPPAPSGLKVIKQY